MARKFSEIAYPKIGDVFVIEYKKGDNDVFVISRMDIHPFFAIIPVKVADNGILSRCAFEIKRPFFSLEKKIEINVLEALHLRSEHFVEIRLANKDEATRVLNDLEKIYRDVTHDFLTNMWRLNQVITYRYNVHDTPFA